MNPKETQKFQRLGFGLLEKSATNEIICERTRVYRNNTTIFVFKTQMFIKSFCECSAIINLT